MVMFILVYNIVLFFFFYDVMVIFFLVEFEVFEFCIFYINLVFNVVLEIDVDVKVFDFCMGIGRIF